MAIDIADFRRLTGDTRVNDLAVWLLPGSDKRSVQESIRSLAPEPGPGPDPLPPAGSTRPVAGVAGLRVDAGQVNGH